MTSEEAVKTSKSKVFIVKKPVFEDKFVFVTHLEEQGNAHLEHNPVKGEYQTVPCNCKVEKSE